MQIWILFGYRLEEEMREKKKTIFHSLQSRLIVCWCWIGDEKIVVLVNIGCMLISFICVAGDSSSVGAIANDYFASESGPIMILKEAKSSRASQPSLD